MSEPPLDPTLDAHLRETLSPLAPSPDLESRLITHFQESTMPRYPLARRAAIGIAAAVALAATGVLANHLVSKDVLTNPLTRQLASSESATPPWTRGLATQPATKPAGDAADWVITETAAVNGDANTTVLDKFDREKSDYRRRNAPVHYGADPNAIADSDDIITQVIPVTSVDAVRLRNDLIPTLSPTADSAANAGSNSIIITDTSRNIRKAVTAIAAKDILNKNAALSSEYLKDMSDDERRGMQTVPTSVAKSGTGSLALNDATSFQSSQNMMRGNSASPQVTLYNGQRSFTANGGTISPNNGNIYGASGNGTLALGSAPTNAGGSAGGGGFGGRSGADGRTALSNVTNDGGLTRGTYSVNGILQQSSQGQQGGQQQFAGGFDATVAAGGINGTATVGGNNAYRGETTIVAGAGSLSTDGRFTIGAGVSTNSGLYGQVIKEQEAFDAKSAPATGTPGSLGGGAISSPYDYGMLPVTNVSGGDRDAGKSSYTPALPPSIAVVQASRQDASSGEKLEADRKGKITDLMAKADQAYQSGDYRAAANTLGVVTAIDPQNSSAKLFLQMTTDRINNRDYQQLADQRSTQNTRQGLTDTEEEIPYQDLLVYPDDWVQKNRQVADASGPVPMTPSPSTRPASTQPSSAQSPPTPPAPQTTELKIIRNGTVEFEVRSFEDASTVITSVVKEEGGYVSSTSSDRLANGKIRGSIVLRVPPEHLETLLLKIRGIGDLKNQQIAASDVTKEYTDIDSELRALRAMESRLIDLIKNGKGEVKDLVEAEKQLGEYRVRIEKLEGDIRYYNNLVGMATLTITAYEKDIQKAAAATEQEVASIDLQTEEIETRYSDARKVIEDAKGRVVDSAMKKGEADQITAFLVADVPADHADAVMLNLRALGAVTHFERSRKQTTSGGEDSTAGPNSTGLAVTEKDARITLSLSNLASVQPRETMSLTLAAEDVQSAYQTILSAIRDNAGNANPAASQPATRPAGAMGDVGRIVNSSLSGNRPEQMSANISAEVRAESLDKVLTALKKQGALMSTSLSQNANSGATSVKEGLQIQILAAAAVPPRQTTAITLAADDVAAAYQLLLDALHAPSPAGEAPSRVINSQLTGSKPEEMNASLLGEVPVESLDKLLLSLRSSGILLAQSVSQNNNNGTSANKQGLSIQIVSSATVPARETMVITLATDDVAATYQSLLTALHTGAAGAPPAANGIGAAGRVITSQLAGSRRDEMSASLQAELRADAVDKILALLKDKGAIVSQSLSANTNSAATPTKERLSLQIVAAASLAPRRSTTLGIELADAPRALDHLRASLPPTAVILEDVAGADNNGRTNARLTLDVPVADALKVLSAIRDLGGEERVNNVQLNPDSPDTRYAKERISVSFSSRSAIVAPESGLWTTTRSALASALAALSWSLYLVLTGILFLSPWLLLLWLARKLWKRRRPTPT